jgi:carbon monoxide dehydrogenase subunit G
MIPAIHLFSVAGHPLQLHSTIEISEISLQAHGDMKLANILPNSLSILFDYSDGERQSQRRAKL